MIDLLKDGQFVFSYYPDQAWLARSALLNCPAARRQHDAVVHHDSTRLARIGLMSDRRHLAGAYTCVR